jgi:hypothetical protein
VAIPITVRCECGETHPAKLGETVECSCGRRYDTSKLDHNWPQAQEHKAKAKLYVRVGFVFIAGTTLAALFFWGIWGAAITAPMMAVLWFWFIRRWFMRKFVPSPGELPTFELEASNE